MVNMRKDFLDKVYNKLGEQDFTTLMEYVEEYDNLYQMLEKAQQRRGVVEEVAKAKLFTICCEPDIEFGHYAEFCHVAVFGNNSQDVAELVNAYAEYLSPEEDYDIHENFRKNVIKNLTEEKIDIVLDTETGLEELTMDFKKEVKPALLANFDKHGTPIL